MATTVSSSTKIAATASPGPLALGSSDPSSPQTSTQATTLMTVAQIQPRRRCSSRTVAATAGSESVTAASCEPIALG